jgi:RNA polymerase sigma-70 factor, ECF subfamily
MKAGCDITEEQKTVLRAQEGDRAAFSQLVDAYDRRLLYFVRRILGDSDSAFDVLQDVWLIVHRRLRGLVSARAFRVWIYRIAHDQAVGELRKKTRRPLLVEDVEFAADEKLDPCDFEADLENAELVHLGLQRLSLDHRRILTLRYLEDMKVAEIAEVLSCHDGTVKSRLHHARLALRRRIEELQHE